jgi:hypothetical protein
MGIVRATGTRNGWVVALLVSMIVSLAAAAALPGCSKDNSKQDFVNGLLSIIEDNQGDSQIAEAGQQAFQAYFASGFTDLAAAQAAADSFAKSNDKDQVSLGRLEQLARPDAQATAICDDFEKGVVTMDEGNSVFAAELEKAPGQSVEERSLIYEGMGRAMEYYLRGLDYIIKSMEDLVSYIEANKLEGKDSAEVWAEKFKAEKESLEQAIKYM